MSEQEMESKTLENLMVEPAGAEEEPSSKTPDESAEAVHPEEIVAAPRESAEAGDAALPSTPAVMPPPESRTQFDQLKAERDQLADRLVRLQAEFENARKRAERDRASDRDYATGSVVKQFLPVLDNFELALKSTGEPEQLRAGVELIRKQFEDILRQLHVHAIPAVGEEFDPRLHEALGSVECDDVPDQHVAEEIRRGYKLRERMLRPALVRVASNPKQTNE
jgi:molecular chaperone GrpE